ncbi:MarR family winged helix-turn-helix transcriptional regulator [Sporomusa sp.]|jgi:DNA-binding MarR family transcriptional regulator|uniref:MarR family winged helix-turn-helix transcriptional regulator n=1 Tax=Sporomusa sp. TaxID=2078658 RepID=UPI002B622285|nr:MarR family winged helix-turn-helix transcriptional regulator [Sporomusa sp.]HWR07239.1 MarR family winged helix-turn-helix transcriptional regulator [Sporomusa sp.]
MTNDSIDIDKYNRCVEDIGGLLQRTVRICQLFEREQIKVHGFTSSQCYILLEVLKSGTLTINEISSKMNLEISTITRIMDNLVRDQLLVRNRLSHDKRVVEASLTEKGIHEANKLRESIRDYYKNVISHLPPGHVREVMSAVELLLTAVEQSNKQSR